MDTARIFCGFDQREAIAFHVFAQSIIERASIPVEFHPLARQMLDGFDGQQDGSNAFVYSRYLVPHLCNFTGWALFADGDMCMDADIAELWEQKNEGVHNIAVKVVKHDYQTRYKRKYVGTKMEADNVDYVRKNWSSVMLWNCAHHANRILTPEFVATAGAEQLHRFKWLQDEQIGELPSWWNYLVRESPPNPAKLYHHTLGIPGIRHYADDYGSWKWHAALMRMLSCPSRSDSPVSMVHRSADRVGEPGDLQERREAREAMR